MSTLNDRIVMDLRAALKAGEHERLSVLRMAKTALHNKQIALGRELDETEVISVLQKEVKQRTEAMAEFLAGHRPELAAKEEREAAVLTAYLPAQLTNDELSTIVDQVIAQQQASSGATMGPVMSAVQTVVAGRADGQRIARLVKAKLGLA
ncbi:GatB/YqeY domain-containing protein [Candidatus Berkelbacteria bacterium]|nr:GatB/YqeY domain-containing protein [Candidatus Berkelbacteria bacterium]